MQATLYIKVSLVTVTSGAKYSWRLSKRQDSRSDVLSMHQWELHILLTNLFCHSHCLKCWPNINKWHMFKFIHTSKYLQNNYISVSIYLDWVILQHCITTIYLDTVITCVLPIQHWLQCSMRIAHAKLCNIVPKITTTINYPQQSMVPSC